jgi:hypothetical protein
MTFNELHCVIRHKTEPSVDEDVGEQNGHNICTQREGHKTEMGAITHSVLICLAAIYW